MKTFKDLKFEHQYSYPFAMQAVERFDNGYGVSVLLGGYGIYSDGKTTYEVAILKDKDIEDVYGSMTARQVTKIMREVQEREMI